MAAIPDHIASAAIEVFRRKGYDRATVRDIADEAGIRVSSLYSHIKSKEELFLDLLVPVIESVSGRIAEISDSREEPATKLRAAMVAATSAFDEHYPELFIYLRDFYPVLESANPDLRERYENTWIGLFQEGIDEGVLRSDLDPRILAYGVLGMVGWMHHWYRRGGRYSAQEIGELYADALIDGLRA